MCWICEGWVPATFEYTPGKSNKWPEGEVHDPFNPIFLHLEQDDWKRDLMLPEDENVEDRTNCKYISTRMVKPG